METNPVRAAAPLDDLSLALAETDFREAVERAEQLRALRNDLVRIALDQGWTHARIARATGLTRGRVGQLASHLIGALAGRSDSRKP